MKLFLQRLQTGIQRISNPATNFARWFVMTNRFAVGVETKNSVSETQLKAFCEMYRLSNVLG